MCAFRIKGYMSHLKWPAHLSYHVIFIVSLSGLEIDEHEHLYDLDSKVNLLSPFPPHHRQWIQLCHGSFFQDFALAGPRSP